MKAENFLIHTVKPGETMWEIAKMYDIPCAYLIGANMELSDPNRLPTGYGLRLPLAVVQNRVQMMERILRSFERYQNALYMNDENGSKSDCCCSELIYEVFRENGIWFPRECSHQSLEGVEIPFSNIERGDLLFFTTRARSKKYPIESHEYLGHAALYLGDRIMIHPSSNGKHVTIFQELSDYYRGIFVVAKRIDYLSNGVRKKRIKKIELHV